MFENILILFTNFMVGYKYGEYSTNIHVPIDIDFFDNLLKKLGEDIHCSDS